MKLSLLILTILLALQGVGFAVDGSSEPKPERFSVYIFLGEECIISQQYTLLLKRLHKEYGDERISFVGLFPNPSSSVDKMEMFEKKYGLGFELKLDVLQKNMDRFEVRVTPEVVVFNERKKEVIYQGRIDNMFYRVGKRRTVTTTSELEDVLVAIQEGKPVLPKRTEAIGCFITPLDVMMKNVKMCNTPENSDSNK